MDQATGLRKMVRGESRKVYRLTGGGGLSAKKRGPRVVAITSGKGGVGKTNVAVNVGVACQRMGKRVLIFDADLGLANIDIIFGITVRHTIEDIVRGEKELSQIIIEGPEGVSIIPASSGVQELSYLTEGQKINLLNEFDRLNRKFDIMLIDTGAGISSNVIFFNLGAEQRIVVVTPEPTSMTDAYALIKVMFSRHGVKHFCLLANMVEDDQEGMSVYKNLSRVVGRFMGGVSMDYAGFIPRDACLQEAVSRRQPVVCCHPQATSSKSFKDLANYIVRESANKDGAGNIQFFWRQLLCGVRDSGDESGD